MGKINRNNLLKRTLTGAGFVVVILGSVLLDHYLFSFIFLLITVLTIVEFLSIQSNSKKKLAYYTPAILGSALIYITTSLVWFGILHEKLLLVNLLIIPLILIPALYITKGEPLKNITLNIFGIVYIAIPFSSFNLLFLHNDLEISHDLAIGFFIIIWVYDSFAYLTGVKFGKHRLFERISPKKSWEGTIGGFLFGLLVAWILANYLLIFDLEQWLIVAVIIMVFGTFGDLVESLLKRSLNIKDSGKLLPGHGGLLDRFDATLLAAPAVVVYVHLLT